MKKLLAAAAALSVYSCGGGGGGGETQEPQSPELRVSPTAVNLAGTVGAQPAEGAFDVRNAGGGTLSFRASAADGDIGLAPASGSLAAGASARINISYTCRTEGMHSASIGVTGGNRTVTVAVSAECNAAPVTGEPFEYADGPQLPDGAEGKTPWHLTNVRVDFESTPDDFGTFCVTFRIDGEIADGISFYFAPFNTAINQIQFYAGLQTRIDGRNADGGRERRNKGAIFSRWRERDTDAIEAAAGGLHESSGHEGDFIGVRNDFAWNEGRYRLCMRKSGAVPGDPLPDNHDADDVAFAWGKYAHTWVRFEATDLDSGDTEFIGALAFPGTALKLQLNNGLFVEMLGPPDTFPARDVPALTFAVENFQVDDKDLPYRLVRAQSNPISETGREPKMARTRFDADRRVIWIEQGDFTGRFGKIETALLPARAAVESVGLVSLDGDKYIAALWDRREVALTQLPSGRYNIRADPVDAHEVASVRLELQGPVSASRLANDLPYLLSSPTDGLSLPAGDYRIIATPFAQADGQGPQGAALDARFTVTAASRTARVHDPRLLKHVEAALGTPLSGSRFAREWERLESLKVSGGGIVDLDGLQYATNLRVLELPDNRIADLAPLAGLTQLIELDLSGNRIENAAALGGLANLERLDVANNRIADIGPLAGLAAIEALRLSGNRASRLEPLAGLVTLRRLDLARNGIRDLAPLASLADLQVLDISGNRASDLSPLSALVALRQLKANANAIANLAPLAGLADLRRLELSGNRIAQLGPLAGLSNLTHLYASGNRIVALDPLAGLHALRDLRLDANRIRSVGPLAGLPRLMGLSVRFNGVRDFGSLNASVDDGLQVLGSLEQLSVITKRRDRDRLSNE